MAPEWPSEALELYEEQPALDPDETRRARLKKWIVDSADAVGLRLKNLWTWALCAKSYELTGDTTYLTRHAATVDRACRKLYRGHDRWAGHGLAPMTGDHHMARQWPRLLWGLRRAKIDKLVPPPEPGQYLGSQTRFNHDGDIAARGTEILISKPAETTPLTFDAKSPQAASLTALDPSGKPLWKDPQLTSTNKVERPSSWTVYRTERELAGPAGIYHIKVGAHRMGLFQGLAGGLPECQVLQNNHIADWTDPVVYSVQVTSGWLARAGGSAPIKLRWKAAGDRAGSHVTIESNGAPRWDRWLPGGSSDELVLEGPGPWKLDVFGDGASLTTLEIEATTERPLLYGANLDDIRKIAGR